MQEKVFFINQSSHKLAAIIDRDETLPKQKLIILFHGFGNNKCSPRAEQNAEFYRQQGYAVFRGDFRGRGDSEGDIAFSTITAGVEDAKAMIDYVLSLPWVDKGQITFWGNSYGGGIALLAAAQIYMPHKLILISPCIDFQEMYRHAGVDIEQWRRQGFMIMLERRRHISLYDEGGEHNLYLQAKKINIPTLIVHGDADEFVPLRQSQKLAKITPDCTLTVIEGCSHGYLRGCQDCYFKMFETVEYWLNNQEYS